ncbi:replication initiation protein [Moraxella catarrhalis]|uniref:replication initiation protein n=1 Tax=Moraxella catarrhalis TaxID=480 RepID=UPI00128C8EEB|nr:replication initiation protein [Moraxella catarrhalis]MPX68913.1 RepB family plasmid replication initiator protein [Moraxella catarrhalis]MPX85656.1 RepB family plasmid replication initiator protein [Moraxella catarrhalis]
MPQQPTTADKNEIKTAQALVHVKHSITINQYKYWFLLLKTYKDAMEKDALEFDDEGFYFIRLSELEKMMGYEISKKLLKQDLEVLRKEPIVLNYLEKDGKPASKGSGFLSEWKIKGSRVGFMLPSFVLNVLKGDKDAAEMFLLINWNIFNSFTGKYEAIIYKLCLDYMGLDRVLGYGKTPQMSIDSYREYIGLEKNEYPLFKELNRWTITKPIANINNNDLSDIEVEVHYISQGRKVTGLFFTAKYKKGRQPAIRIEQIVGKQNINPPNTNADAPAASSDDNHSAAAEKHPAFDGLRIELSHRKIQAYLEQYTEDQIRSIIERANEYLDQSKDKGKEIKNIAGVYYKALDEAWGSDRIEKRKQEEEAAAKKAEAEAAAKKAALKKKLEEAEEAAKVKAEQDKAILIFEALSESEQEAIVNDILALIPKNQQVLYKPKTAQEDYYKLPPMIFKITDVMKQKYWNVV